MEKEYNQMTAEEKKIDLYLRQKKTLDMFLEKNAISRAQYDKSLGDLTEKMGMADIQKNITEEDNGRKQSK